MKKIKLNKVSIISLMLLALVVLLLVLNAITGNKIVGPIYKAIINRLQGIDIESLMSYAVYDNSQYFDNNENTNDIKVLLEFNNEDGIEYIITPQSKINANGKTKLALDWTTSYNMNEKFTIKLKNQDPIDKFLNITQEDVNNQFEVNVEETENGYINKVNYALKREGDINYYTIGDNFWANYNTENMLIDYTKTRTDPIGDYEGNVEIDLKKVDKNGNTVYAHKTSKVYSNKIYYFYHVKRLGSAGAGLSYNLQGGRENGNVEDYNTINIFDAQLGAYHASGAGGYTADITIDLSKFSQNVDLSNAIRITTQTHMAAYNGDSYSYGDVTVEDSDGTSVTTDRNGFYRNNERDVYFYTEIPVEGRNITKYRIHLWGLDNSNGWAGGWLTSLNFEINPNPVVKTITYNANGGTGSMLQSKEITAPKVVANKFTAPSGKAFKSWNTKPDGTGVTYHKDYTVNEDTTLYAIWVNENTKTYAIGEEVELDGERFFVLADNGSKLTLLSKYNLATSPNGAGKYYQQNASQNSTSCIYANVKYWERRR